MKFSALAKVVCVAALLCHPCTAGAQSAPLPSTIPIFPLEVTMLFPGVSRPLHIFEPRYREMIADALKGDRIIGMATLKPGYEASYAGRPPVYDIGCAGLITEVEELPGGRFNIVLRGVIKFRIAGENDTRSYRLATVTELPEVINEADGVALAKVRERLEVLITKGSTSTVSPGTTDEELVNMVSQYLPMTYAQRQELLELPSVLLRAKTLVQLIESESKEKLTVSTGTPVWRR